MNFFEHQAQARRRSARYVLLFLLATTAIVATVGVAVGFIVWVITAGGTPVPFGKWLRANPPVFWWPVWSAAGAIAVACLYRIATLAGGGSAVAKTLGATLVDGSTQDPRLRQLVNVVEETAIAAGVPVPQIFVLESELGVNAFASGYGPSDAAITVTRGMLTHLSRDELQGVIGHEFSHIFNGDMRLNTRLIGVLFGILFIGLIGRFILRARVRGRGAGPIIAAGLAFFVIGYVGVFFGRLIQSAVSRSRESLADASAVQFTRNPLGLSGALKKIAVLSGVLGDPRSEQVSHMLIASRFVGEGTWFDTHPPILDRIRAIEPNFRATDLARVSREPAVPAVSAAPAAGRGFVGGSIGTVVGQLSDAGLAVAAQRRNAIPATLSAAAHEPTDAPALVLALVLSADAAQRAKQIAAIRAEHVLAPDRATKAETLAREIDALEPVLRLPLFQLAFPALRRRAPEELRYLAALVDKLCRLDGQVSVFEYALSRLLRLQLYEVLAPRARRAPVRAPKLFALRSEVQALLSVLARESTVDGRAAQVAYERGMRSLFQLQAPPYAPSVQWEVFDRALVRLDLLAPMAKQGLVEALVATVLHDRQVSLNEAELLRTICASLHCPLPPVAAAPA